MKKELYKKRQALEENVHLYVSGGVNETSCTNDGDCTSGGGSLDNPGRPMGGNTVCHNR